MVLTVMAKADSTGFRCQFYLGRSETKMWVVSILPEFQRLSVNYISNKTNVLHPAFL